MVYSEHIGCLTPVKTPSKKVKLLISWSPLKFDYYQLHHYDWRYSNQSGAGKSLETGKGSEMQRMTKCPFDLAYSAELLTGEFPVVGVIP
jgi:hypothetical protein